MRTVPRKEVRPPNWQEPYTSKESTIIIKMRDDLPAVARLLGRTWAGVQNWYCMLVSMSEEERWIAALLENAPLTFRVAGDLHSAIRSEFPRVSAAQGKQHGKWFVSVAYRSADGVLRIDEPLYTTGEWPALRERILAVYEVAT